MDGAMPATQVVQFVFGAFEGQASQDRLDAETTNVMLCESQSYALEDIERRAAEYCSHWASDF